MAFFQVSFAALEEVPDLDPSASSLTATLRSWQRNDRTVMDMANRAFVSAVQAYAKHECSFVLRMKGEFLEVLIPF
jgi:hypothetical protein